MFNISNAQINLFEYDRIRITMVIKARQLKMIINKAKKTTYIKTTYMYSYGLLKQYNITLNH